MRDGAAEQPQRHLGRKVGESAAFENDRPALAPRRRRQAPRAPRRPRIRWSASARRMRAARRARPRASSPSRASAGIKRAQPRAGKTRIAIARILAMLDAARLSSVATSRALEMGRSGRTRKIAAPRPTGTAPRAPCRQARSDRCRGQDETAPFPPDHRACARSGHVRIRRASPLAPATDSARCAPPPASRFSASCRASAACDAQRRAGARDASPPPLRAAASGRRP